MFSLSPLKNGEGVAQNVENLTSERFCIPQTASITGNKHPAVEQWKYGWKNCLSSESIYRDCQQVGIISIEATE
jgi:hypothetical protein